MPKTLLLSDESINSYGYRVLTSGIDLKNFKNNPIMLFNHERMSWGSDVYDGPIGRWDNIKVEDGKLYGDAVIDENDPKGKILSSKLENDFIRAASIGFKIIELSEDKKHLLPGQTRPTVTKCELIEVSIVDVPANKNALALYDATGNKVDLTEEIEGVECLNSFLPPINTELKKHSDMKKLTLKAGWNGLLNFLGFSTNGAESVEVELSEEKLSSLNAELEQMAALKADKTRLENELSAANAKTTTLNDKVVGMLKEHKLNEELTGDAALEEINATLTEWGKNSNPPGENGEDDPLETNDDDDDLQSPESKEFNEKAAALRAEMGFED